MIADSTDSIDEFDSRSDLAMLEDICNRYWEVIEERSIAYGDDPIGETGLYNRTLKIRGTRDRPVVFEEYEPEHKLISRLLKTMKYMAIQTRQWKQSKHTDTAAEVLEIITRRLAEGRERVAQARVAREAAEAAKKAEAAKEETQPEERLGE